MLQIGIDRGTLAGPGPLAGADGSIAQGASGIDRGTLAGAGATRWRGWLYRPGRVGIAPSLMLQSGIDRGTLAGAGATRWRGGHSRATGGPLATVRHAPR